MRFFRRNTTKHIHDLVLVAAAALVLGNLPASAVPQAKDKRPKTVKAPVCSMEVDPQTAEKAAYKGKTYYFCSKQEKQDFEKAPEKCMKTSPKKK